MAVLLCKPEHLYEQNLLEALCGLNFMPQREHAFFV